MKDISQDDSVVALAKSVGSTTTMFVAEAYWCEDTWPICSGKDKEKVEAVAQRYLELYPHKYTKAGHFVNGFGAAGYTISEVPIV